MEKIKTRTLSNTHSLILQFFNMITKLKLLFTDARHAQILFLSCFLLIGIFELQWDFDPIKLLSRLSHLFKKSTHTQLQKCLG
jgi:hypothetical protein